jgi:hypothetical protein
MKVNQPTNRLGKIMRVLSSYLTGFFCLIILTCVLGGTPAYGVPPADAQNQEEARALIHQSALATERAWEEFHSAAIGGTLASPTVQTTIESQLHKIRALLMDARKAERANQFDLVKSLTQQILEITQNIVQASREKKQ